MKTKRTLTLFYIMSSVALFLYSFTQVDLGLTLTRHPFFLPIQKAFQHVGYFNRPLSATLYILLIMIFFGLYAAALWFVQKNRLQTKDVFKITLIISAILVFSYNAFSYDLFNYIFDAKIITVYHQNPYGHYALQYPHDAMLGFMHWTQRVYPYGWTWLLVTVPLSILGLQVFTLTLAIFKLLMVAAFVGTVYYIGKILEEFLPEQKALGIALFALNPLSINEFLVSAHNDIVMFFFGVLSFYLLLKKKKVLSWLGFLFAAGIKFATAFLAPVFLYVTFFKVDVQKQFEKIVYASILCMLVALIAVIVRTQFQPWYLVYLLPFAALLPQKSFIRIPVFTMSLFAELQYVPFLYTGNWDPPIPHILSIMLWSSIVVSILAAWLYSGIMKRRA